MKITYFLSFCVLLAAACQSGSGPPLQDDGDPTTPPANGGDDAPLGLPLASQGADCEAPYPLELATWVHGADAIFVGEVTGVELNDEIVYSGETQVDFADCDPQNISAGLRISLSNVVSLRAGMTSPSEVFVGESFASSWAPQPYYVPDTQTIEWAGQGAVVGAGLRLGVAAFYDPDLDVWYGAEYSLFEVDPDDAVLPQSNPCVELPPALTQTDLGALQNAIATAPDPAADDLSQYRQRFAPSDPTLRARYQVASHCLLENRSPDPVTPDPEADAL